MLLSEPQMTNTVHARDSYRPMRLARLGFFVRTRAFLRKLPVAQQTTPINEDLLLPSFADVYVDHRQDQDIPDADVAMEDITPFNSVAMGYYKHLRQLHVLLALCGWAHLRYSSI